MFRDVLRSVNDTSGISRTNRRGAINLEHFFARSTPIVVTSLMDERRTEVFFDNATASFDHDLFPFLRYNG